MSASEQGEAAPRLTREQFDQMKRYAGA